MGSEDTAGDRWLGGRLPDDAVVVTGRGTVRAAADIVVALLGVTTTAATPSEALDRCAARLEAVLSRLREVVAAKDLQTARTSVTPEWVEGRPPRRHHASTTLRVTFRDVTVAAQAVAEAVAAGGADARLNQLGPALDDERAVGAEARRAAFDDARAKASDYAALAGRALGGVIRISEDPGFAGASIPFAARALAAVPAPPAAPEVALGEFEVTAEVTVTFGLVDG